MPTPPTSTAALTWDGYAWAGTIPRGVWASVDVRYSPDDRRRRPARGRPPIAVSVRPVRERPPAPPQAVQLAATAYHVDHAAAIMGAVLPAILDHYLAERAGWVAVLHGLAHLVPPIRSTRGLRSLVRLTGLHVMPFAKDDLAYTGLEFACSWDDEHGLGVMTYGDRVIAVGAADTAWNVWRCRDDGGRELVAAPASPPLVDDAGGRGIELLANDEELVLTSALPPLAPGVPAAGIELPADERAGD